MIAIGWTQVAHILILVSLPPRLVALRKLLSVPQFVQL